MTRHDGAVLVDKTTGQFSHVKHLELKHWGKIPWESIRAAVRFNPEKHLPLLQEQKLILSKDGYSIPLALLDEENIEVSTVLHSIMKSNQEKGKDEMRKHKSKITDKTWRQHVADLHVPVAELHRKLGIARSTAFGMRAVLEGRKKAGWKNHHPPADVVAGIPYHPLAVNIRSEVGNEISEVANAANAENQKALVTIVNESRHQFTGADIRRIAGLLDKPADEIAKVMGRKVNTIYVWLRLLKGEIPMGAQRFQKIPTDILKMMPLTEPYRLASDPTENSFTEPTEQVPTSLPSAVGESTSPSAPAPEKGTSTTGSLIGMIDALSEKFLAAASELADKKSALQALLDMEGQRSKTRSLLQEFDELNAEISNVLGS